MIKNSKEIRSALIVGASSGLGKRIAIDYSQNGYHVHLVGRNESALNEILLNIQSSGGTGSVICADIRNSQEVANAIQTILAITPTLDVAINCAGVVRTGAIDEMSDDDFELMLQTNLTGIWHCMKHELKQMKQQKSGTIINISANIGMHTIRPMMSGYGASKAALTVLTQTAALEVLPFNVKVHAISPGPLDTALSYRPGEDQAARDSRIASTNPSKRVGNLVEVSSVCLWLSTCPSYLVGQDIIIDGGASL